MLEDLKRTLGSKVRAARKRAGLSQDELGERIGKTPESVSNIERGRHLPMLDTLASLAKALEVPLAEFFEGAGSPDGGQARVQLEAHMRELVRGLDDEALKVAVQQVEALAGGFKR